MPSHSFGAVPRLQKAAVAVLAIVSVIALVSPTRADDKPPNVALPVNESGPSLDEKLANITLSLEFNNASLSEAFEYLTMISKKRDPDQRGVKFTVEPDALKEAKMVTLTLNNVSLGDALHNICRLGNVKFKLNKSEVDIVSIRESAEGVNTTTQTGSETSVAITHKLQTIVLPKINWNKLDIAVAVQFLAVKSKQYDPDKEGVNFVLSNIGAADKIYREVTISIDSIALTDLLPLIAQQTNLRYSIKDGAVDFHP